MGIFLALFGHCPLALHLKAPLEERKKMTRCQRKRKLVESFMFAWPTRAATAGLSLLGE